MGSSPVTVTLSSAGEQAANLWREERQRMIEAAVVRKAVRA